MEIIIPWQNQGAHGINNSYCSRAARGDVDQQSTPERQCARSALCACPPAHLAALVIRQGLAQRPVEYGRQLLQHS